MIRLSLFLFLGFVICDTQSVSDAVTQSEYSRLTTMYQPAFGIHNESQPLKSVLEAELKSREFGLNYNQVSLDCYRKPKVNKNRDIQKKSKCNNQTSINSLIKSAEQKHKIPEGLLLSIARVETGVRPYTINYNGRGYFFRDIATAVSFAKSLVVRGITNFSVGCCQLHYQSHAKRFNSIHDMFNPQKNIDYAAKLLKTLYKRRGYNWQYAINGYHSGYDGSNRIYYSKVVKRLGRSI